MAQAENAAAVLLFVGQAITEVYHLVLKVLYTHSIYINGREKENLHIEISGVNLAKGKSLEEFTNSFNNILGSRASYEQGGMFLLDLRSNKGPKSPYNLLVMFNSTYHGENDQCIKGENPKYVYSVLKEKINEYCKRNNILQSDVKLTLVNLCAFNRLVSDTNDLEKYIQLKNEELSRCTEEELNKQVEKFINLHNYPDYFKNEISTYVKAAIGAEVVKKIEEGRYSKIANNAFNSLNPGNSLQTLQVLALTAIGIVHTQR